MERLRLCVFASLRQAVEEEDGMHRETMTTPSSLVEALRARVERHPQRNALIFIGPNDSVETIAQLVRVALAQAYAALQTDLWRHAPGALLDITIRRHLACGQAGEPA
ncbi:hypothetical protein [Candidatus Chloroploca asiatica]|uniref:hypothetical protein n=1 Tax=Candidatus Chloroploca asiatica TaxID=1506545 RepID=UPI001559FBD3|nr:hypothetical protein [Candidatus Chloroploca asiatica]